MTACPVTGGTAEQLTAADGYVTKPITPSHLIGLATGLIERYRPGASLGLTFLAG